MIQKLVGMEIIVPNSRPTESESLRQGRQQPVFLQAFHHILWESRYHLEDLRFNNGQGERTAIPSASRPGPSLVFMELETCV